MTNGVVFLLSYYEAIQKLKKNSDKLAMYEAIVRYGLFGTEPEFDGPMGAAFSFLKPNLDSSKRKYEASIENGRKGGRPKKEKPGENQTINQNPNQDKDKEKDKDSDRDMDKDMPRRGGGPHPREEQIEKSYGAHGWVRLTGEQYEGLSQELGRTELERCIRYLDESAQSSHNRNGWADWELVIRRCSRDRWGMAPARETKPSAVIASCTLGDAEREDIRKMLRESADEGMIA